MTDKRRKERNASRKKQSTPGPNVPPEEAAKSSNEIFWTENMKRCFEVLKMYFRMDACTFLLAVLLVHLIGGWCDQGDGVCR